MTACDYGTDQSSGAGHEFQDRPAADDAPETPGLASGEELACSLGIPVLNLRRQGARQVWEVGGPGARDPGEQGSGKLRPLTS